MFFYSFFLVLIWNIYNIGDVIKAERSDTDFNLGGDNDDDSTCVTQWGNQQMTYTVITVNTSFVT